MILRISLLFVLAQLSSQQYFTTNGYQNVYNPDTNQYGRNVVNKLLTPYNMSGDNGIVNGGVTIQFQVQGYRNPNLALPDGQTCVCPYGRTCSALRSQPQCYFAFAFVISSPDQSVRYYSTEFVNLDGQGSVQNVDQHIWGYSYVVQLPTKPSAIDVFVHHLGSVLNAADGSIVAADTLKHVDTFVVPLNDVVPAVLGSVQSMSSPTQFTGKLLQTQLSLSYSISCAGNLVGPRCDLSCNASTINSGVAACVSNATGYYHICQYTNNGQVDECKNCPWGIKEGTYCQDEAGGVLNPHQAGVVDTSYKTATIVLSILSIVLLVVIVVLTIAFFKIRSKQQREIESSSFHRAEGAPSQPLLAASYRSDEKSTTPMPLPRQPHPPEAMPIKSSLKKGFGGPSSLSTQGSINNDTRDTTFSDVPVRPSRSEIV